MVTIFFSDNRISYSYLLRMHDTSVPLLLYFTYYLSLVMNNFWPYFSYARNTENGASRFESCYASVHKVIKSYQMDSMTELTATAFYALSYYFDKARDVKLVGECVARA